MKMLSVKQTIGILVCLFIFANSVSSSIIGDIDPIQSDDEDFYTIKQSSVNGERDYWALLVGISDYPGLGDLPYSIHQLGNFHQTLLKGANWNESHIKSLVNDEARKQQIFDEIDWLISNADENDVSIVYFIGHGGRNATSERIVVYDESIADYELDSELEGLLGDVVVIIDTCFSGGFIEELGKPGRIVLTACRKDESTYQTSELESGIFGYYLNKFLGGFTHKIETAFILTWIFSIYYSSMRSKDSGVINTIHPMIYDGTISMTRVIHRSNFMKVSFNRLLADLFNGSVREVWEM